jgi:hypothetical protein
MIIASSKNSIMFSIIYLPEQHPLKLDTLTNGRFYSKDCSYAVQVPHSCAHVWCPYNGDYTNEGHSWTNPISGHVYKTHPLGGLTNRDSSFYEGFYEITSIKDLTFLEGEAWCSETNQKIRVEKTDARSVWNPLFQRYDPPCESNTPICDSSPKVRYDPSVSNITFCGRSLDQLFNDNMEEFLKVFCKCCICERCTKIHDYSCAM